MYIPATCFCLHRLGLNYLFYPNVTTLYQYVKCISKIPSENFASESHLFFFAHRGKKLIQTAPSLAIFLFVPFMSPAQFVTSVLFLIPRPSPALPVVHSSGWEWTSQLAPLKETHISGCSPFASVIFPSLETWPLSVHGAEYITLPLPAAAVLPGLCCRCYHTATQVLKGLSGYSSHYWLLNLVMVVKALPVPPCLRGQLMACFMSLQRRASLLGHRFHSHPLPSHASSRRRLGWIGRPRTSIHSRTRVAKKKNPPKSRIAPQRQRRPVVICDLRLYEMTGVAGPGK